MSTIKKHSQDLPQEMSEHEAELLKKYAKKAAKDMSK
jgi:hypothetical protein